MRASSTTVTSQTYLGRPGPHRARDLQNSSREYAGSGRGEAAPTSLSTGTRAEIRARGITSATAPAQAATTAETANARVNPASVAIPATALPARIVAETCE